MTISWSLLERHDLFKWFLWLKFSQLVSAVDLPSFIFWDLSPFLSFLLGCDLCPVYFPQFFACFHTSIDYTIQLHWSQVGYMREKVLALYELVMMVIYYICAERYDDFIPHFAGSAVPNNSAVFAVVWILCSQKNGLRWYNNRVQVFLSLIQMHCSKMSSNQRSQIKKTFDSHSSILY